ncbi:MAG: hypothetical protein CL609_15170 [Anaerolineaceae bacterium]|nr:hypothetical protein [Anaerolineaceae bacterium]
MVERRGQPGHAARIKGSGTSFSELFQQTKWIPQIQEQERKTEHPLPPAGQGKPGKQAHLSSQSRLAKNQIPSRNRRGGKKCYRFENQERKIFRILSGRDGKRRTGIQRERKRDRFGNPNICCFV